MKNARLKLNLTLAVALLAASISGIWPAQAETTQTTAILIQNANVFDGKNEKLAKGMSVLVEGNKISKIAKSITAPKDAKVIDGGGRTLMPGLIDMHWHSIFATIPLAGFLSGQEAYIQIKGVQANKDALMRGFTTVRDNGGNVFGLKRATDEGLIDGPRIFPAGPMISQTSGHADYRGPNDVPADAHASLDSIQRRGHGLIADGIPEAMKRAREALRMGATHLKVAAGGGVASTYDPLDTLGFTKAELEAIVEVAKTWNTYVTVHTIDDAAVRHAIDAGVQSIEHGQLMSEETIKLMAERGVWLSIQPLLNDEDAIPFPPGSPNEAKFIRATKGTEFVYETAKKHGVKMVFGTDTLFDPALAAKQGKQLVKLTRWMEPWEALTQATGNAGELLKLSGPRTTYPDGPLGVIQEGAYADLLLVDGNPLTNIDLVADPHKNFLIIMKDGKIYKNTLQ